MQAGSVHALDDDDWIFPSYRESAIGLLRGMPAATVLSWWRGHPAGWWNPADYNVASICVPIATHVPHAVGLAWGKKLRGEDDVRDRLLRRRRDLRGRVPRGRELRRRHARAARSSSATTTTGRSRRRSRRRRGPRRSRDKAAGYGMPGVRVDGGDVLAVFEATREAVERARAGDGPTFIEAVTYRAAPHATADDPKRLHRPRARRGGEAATSASAATRATCAGSASSTTSRPRQIRARGARRSCAPGSRPPRPSRPPTSGSSSSTPTSTRRLAFADDLAELRTASSEARAELTLVEAVNDCFHVELERDDDVMVMGEDVGRAGGVFRATAGLRDRFGARPLRRHAARRGRDPRHRGRALHGRLAAGVRDAVRRVQLPLPRPAHQPRRAATAGARAAGWSSRSRCGCRTAAACARPSCTTTRPRPTTSTRRGQGRDPVDAGRREGAARGGDPRSRTRSSSSSRSSTTARCAARCRRASTSSRSGRRGSRARGPT